MSEKRERYEVDGEIVAEFSNIIKEARAVYDSLSFIHSSLDDAELTPDEFRVYCHMLRRAGADGQAWPSYQSIGNYCFGSLNLEDCTCRRKATLAVKSLCEKNMLVKEKRAGRKSNVYIISPPSHWCAPHTSVPDTPMTSVPDTPKGTPIEGTPNKEENFSQDPMTKMPKQRKESVVATGFVQQAKDIGLTTAQFVDITNQVIDECALRVLIDNDPDSSSTTWKYNGAKETAIFLAKMGYDHSSDVHELALQCREWLSWRSDPTPSPSDLKTFVSKGKPGAEEKRAPVKIEIAEGDYDESH